MECGVELKNRNAGAWTVLGAVANERIPHIRQVSPSFDQRGEVRGRSPFFSTWVAQPCVTRVLLDILFDILRCTSISIFHDLLTSASPPKP
jgi:hypothetical protein